MKRMIALIGVFCLAFGAGQVVAQPCERTITLDIRTIDYKSKPYDPMLKPLLDKVDPDTGRIELTFASSRIHPEIVDLQAAGLKYVQSKITLQGYAPTLIQRQEVMLPRSFAGKDELYRLIVTYGPKEHTPAC